MPDISVLLVFMLVNGQPTGPTISLQAVTPRCESEMATIRGINMVSEPRGVSYQASCERDQSRFSQLINRSLR
jgi:hypothetical protein